MTGGNVFNKNYPSAMCEHCGKSTNIGLSHSYCNLVAQNKTQKETIKFLKMDTAKIHQMKNGQIQTLHKSIQQLVGLMTSEQVTKAKAINQGLRDEMRMIEKRVFGKFY